MNFIEKKKRLFSKKFQMNEHTDCRDDCPEKSDEKQRRDKYLNFLEATVKEAVLEFWKEIKLDHKTCGGDLQMNDEYEQCKGYNEAVKELETRHQKLTKKMFGDK